MKNKLVYIIGGIIALVLAGWVAVRSWMNRIQYGIDAAGIKITHLGFDSVQLKLPVWIYNPTPFDVVIKGFNVEIYIDDIYAATLNTDANYMLKSKVASQYPLLVNLPTAPLIQILKEKGAVIDQPNWQEKVRISVVGSVGMESGIVNINRMSVNFDDSLKNWMA
jgi:LEA14-like dessication related protein